MIDTPRAARRRYSTHCLTLEHDQIAQLRRLADQNATSVSALARAALDWLLTHPQRFRLMTTPNERGTMPNAGER